jgi:GNAT superfamily N-acetyltransferase
VRFQRVVNELPADFDTIRAEARAEGYRFLDRLASDWASGAMRFDRPGEALLAASSDEVLTAIGGITIDPIVPDALRMRRFYVRPAFRRTGIGRDIAEALLERARSVPVVTLNAAVKSVSRSGKVWGSCRKLATDTPTSGVGPSGSTDPHARRRANQPVFPTPCIGSIAHLPGRQRVTNCVDCRNA